LLSFVVAFAMPLKEDVAGMLRADLAAASRVWLKATRHDTEEQTLREQSDSLVNVNHEGFSPLFSV